MLGVGVAASGIWQEVETESGSAARFKLVSWQKMYTVIMSLINSLQGIQFWNELTFSRLLGLTRTKTWCFPVGDRTARCPIAYGEAPSLSPSKSKES
eukprot:gene27105-biopygen6690